MDITSLQWTSAARDVIAVSADGATTFMRWPSPYGGLCERISEAMADGMTIAAEDPPATPTQDQIDAAAAREYANLVALRGMTPAQVVTWVSANVTSLAQAQDAIATLAVAVAVLARRL